MEIKYDLRSGHRSFYALLLLASSPMVAVAVNYYHTWKVLKLNEYIWPSVGKIFLKDN